MSENGINDNLGEGSYETALKRNKTIVRTSIIGIAANVMLAAFKAAVGAISNSIAVTLDAVNNLSDAISSIITIIGAKLSAKRPDKKHPLGHGRAEYLSAMIVAAIVLYAGITAFTESVKKIIHPETPDYSTVSLVIIAVAVLVKIILGTFVKRQGVKVNSGSLIASGSDALFDAVLSSSVLASAVIYLIWGISLEAYVGVVISIFIVKSGIEMMKETVNDIIGKRSDPELTKQIKSLICSDGSVMGAYDLIINNYGPDKNYASVHIEVADTLTADEIDVIERRLTEKVYSETGIILTAIGVYSYNTQDNESAQIREKIRKTVMAHEWALQIHGFYVDVSDKNMRFDVVLSFDIEPKEALGILYSETAELFPDYKVSIAPDVDLSDI
ncbi:MAG: cation diffusion facilitator family transporter [Clostridia bacterium]|nr:cation diffusion facilitator family transporter [Clostridia bacterium]